MNLIKDFPSVVFCPPQEMDELNEKMRFLNKRMQDAEGHKWKGMFKKHPLW